MSACGEDERYRNSHCLCHSIDWLVGKGGFGEVYYGYRLEPEEVSQTSQASRSNGQRSTTVSPNNSFTDAPVSDQVAIKLER